MEAVSIAEVTEQMIPPEMPIEFVVVHVALVTELTKGVTPVRSVVRVAKPPVSCQVWSVIAAALSGEDLKKKVGVWQFVII